MVKISGIGSLVKRLDIEKLRATKQVTAAVQKIVTVIFTDLVVHTPQYTGNLTSNWYIDYGSHQGGYRQTSGAEFSRTDTPHKRGDNPAVQETLERELAKLSGLGDAVAGKLRWNSKINLVNYAPYAADVDAGIGPIGSGGVPLAIRPENLYYGTVFMAAKAEIKYGKLSNLARIVG